MRQTMDKLYPIGKLWINHIQTENCVPFTFSFLPVPGPAPIVKLGPDFL